jgi:putative ABC transport system permease protein
VSVPGFGLIAAAGRLVPEDRRGPWRREWEGETAYAWQRLRQAGVAPWLARLRLRLRVSACVLDAILERREAVRMTGLGKDLRVAVRGLIRKPGFTAITVLTLALGIGATTAVFTLLDGVLLRPLPFPESDELLSLQHLGRDGQDELPISPGLYLLYRDQARTLESIALYNATVGNLVVDGEPERVAGQVVTPSFFTTLEATPAHGRTFVEEEGRPGGAPVIVLSDELWRSRFGGAPSIVGSTVDINGVRREVVGVMPGEFGYPDRNARFWLPLVVDEAQAPVAAFFANGIARMAEGQTVESTRTELEGMLARLTELLPGDGGAEFLKNVSIRTRIASLKDALVGDLRTTLWILFATVGIVLVIACANVANLLLVRAEGRQRELAVRMALGAGRAHVVRSFMAESVVLAAVGSALGVAVAAAAVRLATALVPTELPRMAEIGIDARVLAFTAAVAVGCAAFFGLFPLLRYQARDLAGQLREGNARGATSGRERNRLRNGLVVSQVALALVLLIGSGLMLRSFFALRSLDPGFAYEDAVTARVTVPTAEVADPIATESFFLQLQERLAARPGVTAVGLASAIPLGGGGNSYQSIEVEDHPRGPDELPVFASWLQAGPGYFEAMGIEIQQGRGFDVRDGGDAFRAVVVSSGFARKWWPDRSPIGRRMRFGFDDEAWYEIVGVAEDVRQQNLEEVADELVYFPLVIEAGPTMQTARALDVVVRTSGDPLAFVAVLRAETRALNARIPIANPRTLRDVFVSATARTSFTMAMLGAASGIALLLGLVGIYGVISYVVSQRTREIGVRMALGASTSVVRGMVVRQGLLLSGAGVALGLVASALLSRVLRSLLYGVGAIDPLTYVVLAAALVGVAVLASLIPALRAASVDPSRALRME